MKEINIAELLKDKPKGLKLYSPVYGEVEFEAVHKDKIYFYHGKNEHSVKSNGKSFDDGEIVIFPSKEMRDWSKFAWKKGDVLINSVCSTVFFRRWADDAYRGFYAEIVNCNDVYWYATDEYALASEEDAKNFIAGIEKKFGGKLNLETLKIEKPKQKFRNGDIVFVKGETKDSNAIAIIKEPKNGISNSACWAILFYARNELRIADGIHGFVVGPAYDDDVREANRSEAMKLLDALNAEGMRWNADKKVIEDLPKECKFYPYQKVLVRKEKGMIWIPTLFGYYDERLKSYVCVNACFYGECIPYTEETKHLLGTTEKWEQG